MTKLQELNKEYKELKDKDLEMIILYIHMPTGETEIIINPEVKEKVEYINKTYTEELVHKGCSQIYIEEFIFVEESQETGFGYVLESLKDGKKATRKGWHKDGMYIQIQNPGEYSKMNGSYIYITIDGYLNPWHPSQADMLEEDWIIID